MIPAETPRACKLEWDDCDLAGSEVAVQGWFNAICGSSVIRARAGKRGPTSRHPGAMAGYHNPPSIHNRVSAWIGRLLLGGFRAAGCRKRTFLWLISDVAASSTSTSTSLGIASNQAATCQGHFAVNIRSCYVLGMVSFARPRCRFCGRLWQPAEGISARSSYCRACAEDRQAIAADVLGWSNEATMSSGYMLRGRDD